MKYADAYVSLLLLTGNGSIIIFNRNKEEFQRPPVESIKSILNHIESGVFYFPMTSYFDAIGLSRFQSNMKFLREFYPYNFLVMLL